MLVVVAYDVNTQTKEGRKRLRRVAQTCEDRIARAEVRVRVVVRERDWVLLRARLLKEFDANKDSLRFYFLDELARARTEHHGVGRPIDLEAPLIV